MKVQQVKITNFKGITDMHADLSGRSVFVTGANGAGKSSFIDAIFSALTGKNMPPSPIKGQARTGSIEVELDGYAIEVKFKKVKGGKVKKELALYSTEDGEKLDSPRAKIDQIIGTLDFDPFKFMQMQPKPQLDYFCKVFGIKGIKAIDDDYQELNEVINFDTKELKALESQLMPYDEAKAGQDLKTAGELAEELRKANEHNNTIDNFVGKLDGEKRELERINEEIARLEAKRDETQERIQKGEAWLSKQSKTDTSELTAQLSSIDTDNEAIREAKKQHELHEKANKLEQSIEESKQAKADKLAEKKAKIAEFTKQVEGLEYGEDGFTLDGLPFHIDQNNTAAQIVAGLKLGAGLLGDVKIARFEGSLLDQENLDKVHEFAEAQGVQLFVELVDRENSELRLEFIES